MLDVVVLFFLLGLLAGLARSELKLPPALYDSLSLVLLLAIGLKGGEGLARQALLPLLPQLASVIVLGVVLTIIAFVALRRRFALPDSASMAAHYGSVSVATFAVGVNWLNARGIDFEPQLPIFLAVMEVPPIIVGIVLARGLRSGIDWTKLGHEAFFGKGVVLLLGGMAIGWLAGPAGLEPVKPLFYDLFKGALAIFLLEMGLIVARQTGVLRRQGAFLITFGIAMPLFSSLLGGRLRRRARTFRRRNHVAGDAGGFRVLHRRAGDDAAGLAGGEPGAVTGRRARRDLPLQHPRGHSPLLSARGTIRRS